MYWFAIIFCEVLGAIFLGAGLWHEYTWWKRTNWIYGNGTIIGYETRGGPDSDTYPAVIEYQFSNEPRTFVSEYGSNLKPIMGLEVTVCVSPDGLKAERFSLFNRFFNTIAFGVPGLLIMLYAPSLPAPAETERVEIRGAYHDPQATPQTKSVAEPTENEAEKVERFLEGAR